MNWNERVRRTHRAVAIAFVATVVVTIAVMALRGPAWVSYLALLPLAGLLLSGIYLYVLPYRGTRRAAGTPPRRDLTRAVHRWAAAAFVVSIGVTAVTLALQGPIWVSYLPLLPLAALLISGLTVFVRPRAAGSRDDRPQHPATVRHDSDAGGTTARMPR